MPCSNVNHAGCVIQSCFLVRSPVRIFHFKSNGTRLLPIARTGHPSRRPCVASVSGLADDGDLRDQRQRLNRMLETPSISGQELRDLIVSKWGKSYDARIHKRGRRMYLQIMWKFLEQRSFHMSEQEYQAQLDAVAEYLTLWRVAPTVRAGIRSATARGPGYTGGGGARAVSIPLDVDIDGGRSGEWDTF